MPVNVRSLAEWEEAGVPGMLSVVMPAHNEAGHIEQTVRALIAALDVAGIHHEILVVNDASTDATARVLTELERELPSLRHIDNAPPNGYGFAVRCGLAEFAGEAVAIVMADGSDSPADVVAFWRRMQEGYDCVFGS